jgi:hypothetical protein
MPIFTGRNHLSRYIYISGSFSIGKWKATYNHFAFFHSVEREQIINVRLFFYYVYPDIFSLNNIIDISNMLMPIKDVDDTKYRFCDASEEPCNLLAPISGFNEKPLVTLEQAAEPLISIVPDILFRVSKAKRRAATYEDTLPIDESAAIVLYTMEWHPFSDSVYYILNSTLRTEDRKSLIPWFLYLKLILTALSRLPLLSLTVYRGVKLNNHDKYQLGKDVLWWGFSSCSINRAIAENEHFLGPNGRRTLFIIHCIKGIDIGPHSYFRKEKEILLLPATTFKVIQCDSQGNNLHIIHLQQIEPLHQLLQSMSTEDEIKPLKINSNIQPSVNISNSKLNEEISRFKDRSDAYLFSKSFTDHDIETVVQQVIITKQCRVLGLRENKLTSQGAIVIGQSLKNNLTLEELYVTKVRLGSEGIRTLAMSLSNRNNLVLKKLCLNHVGITDDDVQHIAKMLETNQSLTHLWLPKNNITDRGIQSLAKVLIKTNKTLQVLALEWNKFRNDLTVNILVEMIEKNKTLTKFVIAGNDLSRANIKKLKTMAKTKTDFNFETH